LTGHRVFDHDPGVAEVEITHVTKTGADHGSITHVGGPAQGGWQLTTARAIQSIRSRAHTFYVASADGARADVRVVEANPPYLGTFVQGQPTSHLLRLPTWVSRAK
jgi:hypothetical protein